jgi:hypothetical protein
MTRLFFHFYKATKKQTKYSLIENSRIMNKPILLLFSILISGFTNAQDWKRTMNWYFGDSAGLSFATDSPTVLTDGVIRAIESCATISDTDGNLLFYTDGAMVWNRNHQVMDNGTGLLGHSSSTQGALIVPYPGNDSLYYIFTTFRGIVFNSGFYYNLININGANGKGEVVRKNVLLHVPVSEKQAAVRHRNGTDYWVSTTDFEGNKMYSYLVGKNGIIECPVVSVLPISFSDATAVGALKFSPSGKLAAMAKNNSLEVDILKYDDLDGTFHHLFSMEHSSPVYGVEFSKSENFLYVMEYRGSLLQYSLENLIQLDVVASKKVIYTVTSSIIGIQALQLGFNKSIYLTFNNTTYLGVINNPDTVYNLVNFDTAGQHLGGKKNSSGLPAVVSSFFYTPPVDFSYSLNCENNRISLVPRFDSPGGTISWNLYKTSNGARVFSSGDFSPEYAFEDTGFFDINLTYIIDNYTLTSEKQIHIKPFYRLDLGNDTVLCSGESLLLEAGAGQCYLWQDGSSGPSFLAAAPGIFHVRVASDNHCVYYDSIRIQWVDPPEKPMIGRSHDTLFTDTGYGYRWYRNGAVIPASDTFFHRLSADGYYQVLVSDAYGCTALSDSFSVTGVGIHRPGPKASFKIYPNPTFEGNEIHVEGSERIRQISVFDIAGKQMYEWNNIDDNQFIIKGLNRGMHIVHINEINNHKIIIE